LYNLANNWTLIFRWKAWWCVWVYPIL